MAKISYLGYNMLSILEISEGLTLVDEIRFFIA
jgi:hypothetical protein